MDFQTKIKELLRTIDPVHLNIEDDSHLHASHFANPSLVLPSHAVITVVSDAFHGMSIIKRHRMLNELLLEYMHQVHSISFNAYTQQEWQTKH